MIRQTKIRAAKRVRKIRVLVANGPRLLREVLRNLLERQSDMEVLEEVSGPIELLLAVDTTRPDVVLLASADSCEEPGICSHLLMEYPALVVVAVSPERRCAYIYQQRIVKEQLSTASDEEVLSAIRKAGAARFEK